MTGHTTHIATGIAPRGLEATKRTTLVCRQDTDSTAAHSAPERLATIAAILRHEADALETILPTGGTDVRADVARLREIAGNVDGYGESRRRAA